jgi:hypothetical protein
MVMQSKGEKCRENEADKCRVAQVIQVQGNSRQEEGWSFKETLSIKSRARHVIMGQSKETKAKCQGKEIT